MNESRATRYQRRRRRARTASAASSVVMLAVVALTPLAVALRNVAERAADGLSGAGADVVALLVFVGILVMLCELASLPATAWLAWRVEPAYGQAAPDPDRLVVAGLQAAAVVLPAAIGAGAIVRVSTAIAGSWWWVAAGLLMALLLAGAMRLAPLLFASLGRVRPFARPALAARLSDLAARARVPVAGIHEWVVDESAAATALVTGVGRGRRILVSAAIAGQWSDDEVAVMVAHELAHHAYHDLWRTFALHVSVLWGSLFTAHLVALGLSGPLGLDGPGDLGALPLVSLVAVVVWIAATPMFHAQSRRQERRADAFALSMTGGVDAFGTAVARLGSRRLAEERPSSLTRWLYHRHPSVAERLALADAFRGRQPDPAKPSSSPPDATWVRR